MVEDDLVGCYCRYPSHHGIEVYVYLGRIDDGQLEGISAVNSVLESLEIEQSRLAKISTWPWQPETLCWLVTALVLPLGLWLIQIFLQRLLGS